MDMNKLGPQTTSTKILANAVPIRQTNNYRTRMTHYNTTMVRTMVPPLVTTTMHPSYTISIVMIPQTIFGGLTVAGHPPGDVNRVDFIPNNAWEICV